MIQIQHMVLGFRAGKCELIRREAGLQKSRFLLLLIIIIIVHKMKRVCVWRPGKHVSGFFLVGSAQARVESVHVHMSWAGIKPILL